MKKFFTLFSIALAFSFAAQAQLTPIWGTATVDGYIDANDPWGDTWVAQDSIVGEGDMSSHFQLANDGDNIYIVVEVDDATPNNDPDEIENSYERDCIEVFFSMKSTGFDTTSYVGGDWQIRCQREANITDDNPYIDGSSNAAEIGDDGDIEFAVETNSSSYVIEMAFPIDLLADTSNFDGENFRFDLQTADNDGTGRAKQLFWNSASNSQWDNTSYLGAAVLAKDPTSVIDRAEETLSAYVNGDEIVVSNVSGLVSVYNVAGQLVVSDEIEGKGTINISSLNNGIYIVESNNLSKKIMK